MRTRPVVLAAAVAAGVLLSHTNAHAAITVKACSDWTNKLEASKIVVAPDPPVVGKPLAVTWTGIVKKSIQKGARIVTTGKVGVFEVWRSTSDLCETFKLACPIAASPTVQTIRADTAVQDSIPAGVTIKYRVEAYNPDDSKLFCYETELKFNRG